VCLFSVTRANNLTFCEVRAFLSQSLRKIASETFKYLKVELVRDLSDFNYIHVINTGNIYIIANNLGTCPKTDSCCPTESEFSLSFHATHQSGIIRLRDIHNTQLYFIGLFT